MLKVLRFDSDMQCFPAGNFHSLHFCQRAWQGNCFQQGLKNTRYQFYRHTSLSTGLPFSNTPDIFSSTAYNLLPTLIRSRARRLIACSRGDSFNFNPYFWTLDAGRHGEFPFYSQIAIPLSTPAITLLFVPQRSICLVHLAKQWLECAVTKATENISDLNYSLVIWYTDTQLVAFLASGWDVNGRELSKSTECLFTLY